MGQLKKAEYPKSVHRKELADPKDATINTKLMHLGRRSLRGTRLLTRDHSINIIRRTPHRIAKINALSRRLPKHHRRHTRCIRNHRMKPIHHQHPLLNTTTHP
jgi:hypothetical protein